MATLTTILMANHLAVGEIILKMVMENPDATPEIETIRLLETPIIGTIGDGIIIEVAIALVAFPAKMIGMMRMMSGSRSLAFSF